ncbi:MAG: hypothetical protein IKA00_07990, partial [Prevotella sp.]|nr:hypothetical protein [Prevotella sp.]
LALLVSRTGISLKHFYYFVRSSLNSAYEETISNLIASPEIDSKCFLAQSIFDSSTPRKSADFISNFVAY